MLQVMSHISFFCVLILQLFSSPHTTETESGNVCRRCDRIIRPPPTRSFPPLLSLRYGQSVHLRHCPPHPGCFPFAFPLPAASLRVRYEEGVWGLNWVGVPPTAIFFSIFDKIFPKNVVFRGSIFLPGALRRAKSVTPTAPAKIGHPTV